MRYGAWIVRLALAAAFIGSILLLVISNSSLSRAAILVHSNACQYRLQTQLPESTRIAVIGSSRAREAIDPADLHTALGLEPDAVVNLAHPQIAPGYDYGVISAMTRHYDFDIVLTEVLARSGALEAAERAIDAGPNRPTLDLSIGPARKAFVLGVSLQDQALRVFRDAPNTALALSDMFSLVSNRITSTIALISVRRIYPHLFRPFKQIDQSRPMLCALKYSRDASLLSADIRQQQQAKIDAYRDTFGTGGWVDPAPLGYLTEDAYAFDRASFRDVAELGERRGFAPVFFYVPGVDVPVSPDLADAFFDMFGAVLLIPPPELRRQLADGGYYDNAHLNAKGGKLFADWIAGELRRRGLAPAS
ncbi:MAG: hypothetical protein AAFQ55_00480 [Pseudomonadota bacterium]